MKLTKSKLKQIIKEELNKVLLVERGLYDARFSDDGVSVYSGTKHILTVTKGQGQYYNLIQGAASGSKKAKMELAKQLSQKVGREVSPNEIETRFVDEKALPDAQ